MVKSDRIIAAILSLVAPFPYTSILPVLPDGLLMIRNLLTFL